MILVIGSI